MEVLPLLLCGVVPLFSVSLLLSITPFLDNSRQLNLQANKAIADTKFHSENIEPAEYFFQ